MKKTIYEKAAERLTSSLTLVSQTIEKKFKGVKPLGAFPLTPEEKVYHASKLTPQDVLDLESEFGAETLRGFFNEVDSLKRRLL